MKKGFSLIELLAAVLIIGILSSVALPQYRKAIERARSAEPIAVWNYVEKMARAELTAGTLPSAEDKSICDAWYRAMGLTPLGSGQWKSKYFGYFNENCMRNEISMGACRSDNPGGYPDANAKYCISFDITKSGMRITKSTPSCVAYNMEGSCDFFSEL